MIVRNCRKGVDGRIGGQCKETLDRAPVFLKVSLKNSGLPVVNYGDRSKPLRPASAPQCDEARGKRVLRPGRMAPTADEIPVTIHLQKVHWSYKGSSASTALNFQQVKIARSHAQSCKHTDSPVHETLQRRWLQKILLGFHSETSD